MPDDHIHRVAYYVGDSSTLRDSTCCLGLQYRIELQLMVPVTRHVLVRLNAGFDMATSRWKGDIKSLAILAMKISNHEGCAIS